MEAAIVLIVFIALVIIGVPIGWSIAGVSLLTLFFSDVSFSILPMKMISGVNSFTFLCIPFFILAANLMSRGGITKRIFLFCDALCGHFSGGLAHANVLASMLFGGISGASNADAVGLGSIEIEMMTEKGYDRGYSAAVTAASAILSSIVPPSNIFIVYAVTAGTVTVSAMFVGGIIPAVILTLLLIALNVYYAKKYHFPKNEKFAGWKYVGKTALETLPALFMPIIILGGILAGAGIALCFSQGGSTGGTDIVAMIINKYRTVSYGKILIYSDFVIIGSALLVGMGISAVIYGYVMTAVVGYTVDMIMAGNQQSSQVFIVTHDYEKMAQAIVDNVHRGVTLIDSQGWYSKKESKIVMVVCRKRETSMILKFVKTIDPEAFMTVGSVMGVYGKGFQTIGKG